MFTLCKEKPFNILTSDGARSPISPPPNLPCGDSPVLYLGARVEVVVVGPGGVLRSPAARFPTSSRAAAAGWPDLVCLMLPHLWAARVVESVTNYRLSS